MPTLKSGDRLSHFEVLQKLGEGGMGVVYQARDVNLDRLVALKVLSEQAASDPARRARLIQEAKSASALNHPHIVTIHEIDTAGDVTFIAMEHIDGRPLDQLIPQRGMRFPEVLKLGVQIAHGLAAAHAAGLIHRDVKPANIMVSENGVAKVLDFGLAKPSAAATAATATLTFAQPITKEGAVTGTAAYMSPEQAEAKVLDRRSDIFSLGIVLYEMLSGRRPFEGDSAASTMAAIIRDEPKPLRQAAESIPAELERIVLRCLKKDPSRRFQHADDLAVALAELKEESDSNTLAAIPAVQPAARRRWPAAAAALLLLLVAAGAAWQWSRTRQPRAKPRVVQVTNFAGIESYPAFSPDGRQVAYAGGDGPVQGSDIYVALLGDATPLRLTSDPAPETWPAWSPDGRQVAFRRAGETPGIYTVPALGGPARLVASFITNGPHSWSPKGDWIALAATTAAGQVPGLYLAPAQGGAPRRLPLPEDQVRRLSGAVFSPDGRSIAFVVSRGVVINAIYIQNLTGDYEASGAPRLVAQPNHAVQGIAWTAGQDALVYAGGMGNSRLWKVAADGKAPPEVIELAGLRALYPTLSRDGLRLLYSYSLQDVDIVRLPEAEAPSPQVASTSIEMSPSLSPDGARIAFSSTRSGDPEVWVADADGANAVQVTNKVGVYQGSPSWSPDGRSLAFDSQRRDGLWDIYVTGLSGGVPRKVAEPGYAPSWSRDGKWIYFGSNRTGRDEIWRVAAGGASSPERLTSAGGAVPVESLDGQTLYYVRRAVAGVPLLAKKLPDGPEHEVAPHATRAFAVTAQGIYFMSAKPGNPVDSLCFYDYAKGAVRTVRRLEGASPFGLAASPDGKTLLAALALRRGADLMMIENFEP